MQSVIPIYKPIGLTPLQAILRFKKAHPEYAHEMISYAGRLDPMAEGLLLLLVGEENKKRKGYENLPKSYEFTVLLGVETDTYDILGKITKYHLKFEIGNLIFDILDSFQGKRVQPYPPYSSKSVHGKPLYWWARQKKLQEIVIPEKEVTIYDLQLQSVEKLKINDLRFMIQERIEMVSGNFRQDEILHGWTLFFAQTTRRDAPNDASLITLNCSITCSSGTYIRGIAHEIGRKLDTGAIALSIKRVKIGKYSIRDALTV